MSQPPRPDPGPFGGIDLPDQIVYAPGHDSPELRISRLPRPQAAATRDTPPPPTRRATRPAAPWKPGGEVLAGGRGTRSKVGPLLGIVIGLIPIALLVGLLLIVTDVYGMR